MENIKEIAVPPVKVHGSILVVDDDEVYRQEINAMLKDVSNSIILQDSGSHAVRFFQNQPWNWFPHLVITDIVMDGMGGYQLIRRVHELYPKRNIPIIVISRLNAGVDVGEAEIAGASAYITKPVEPERLYETIKKVMAQEKRGMIVFSSDYGRRKKKRRRRRRK